MTNSWNTPVEAFEHLYPLRIAQLSDSLADRAARESTAAAMESFASTNF